MTSSLAIIWDMDGVLVDTRELQYCSMEYALSEFNIPLPRQVFQLHFGQNNQEVISGSVGRTPSREFVDQVTQVKEKWLLANITQYASLFPGVLDWLGKLKDLGYKQAIASSAPLLTIERMVDQFDIRLYFDAIVSGYHLPSKPDPAIYLEAARQIGVHPQKCVVIEDSIVGVAGAQQGGMKCIGVLTTYSATDLKNADVLTESLDQLPVEIVQKILGSNGNGTL